MISLRPIQPMDIPISATISFSNGNSLYNKSSSYRNDYATETYVMKLALALRKAGVVNVVLMNDGVSTCSNFTKILNFLYSNFGKMTIVSNTRLNSILGNNISYYAHRAS